MVKRYAKPKDLLADFNIGFAPQSSVYLTQQNFEG